MENINNDRQNQLSAVVFGVAGIASLALGLGVLSLNLGILSTVVAAVALTGCTLLPFTLVVAGVFTTLAILFVSLTIYKVVRFNSDIAVKEEKEIVDSEISFIENEISPKGELAEEEVVNSETSFIESLFENSSDEIFSLRELADLEAEECVSKFLKMVVAEKTFYYMHVRLMMEKLIEIHDNSKSGGLVVDGIYNLLNCNEQFWNKMHYIEIQRFGYEAANCNWKKANLGHFFENKGNENSSQVAGGLVDQIPSFPTRDELSDWQKKWQPYFQPEKHFIFKEGVRVSFQGFFEELQGVKIDHFIEYILENIELVEDALCRGRFQPDLESLNILLKGVVELLSVIDPEVLDNINTLKSSIERHETSIKHALSKIGSSQPDTPWHKTFTAQIHRNQQLIETKSQELEYSLDALDQGYPEFNKMIRIVGALFQNSSFNDILARTASYEESGEITPLNAQELFDETQELLKNLKFCDFGVFNEMRKQKDKNPADVLAEYRAKEKQMRLRVSPVQGELRDVIRAFDYKKIEGFNYLDFNPRTNKLPDEVRLVFSALAEWTLYSGKKNRKHLSEVLFSHVFPFLKLPNKQGSFGQPEAVLETLIFSYFNVPPSFLEVGQWKSDREPISCIAGIGGHFTAKIYDRDSKLWFELDSMTRDLNTLLSKDEGLANSQILYIDHSLLNRCSPIDVQRICVPRQIKNICYLSSAWLNFCVIYHYCKQIDEGK